MKNLWLLTTLLIGGLLLSGCASNDFLSNDWEKNDSEIIETYTWKYLASYPFWTEVEVQEPDYSWMTVQKLYNDPNILRDNDNHCWKDIYFLKFFFLLQKY